MYIFKCVHVFHLRIHYHLVCDDGDLRLVDGNTTREGRVEICYDNVYGTVCDDQWGPLDAAVACRQLGFSDAGIYVFIFVTNCSYCIMSLV